MSLLPGPLRSLVDQAALLRWRHGQYRSSARPIIVGGCPRSGTTLTRVILDTHSRIACGPESRLFTHALDEKHRQALARRFDLSAEVLAARMRESGSLSEFIEGFFAEYCRKTGKARWAEKTPRNVLNLPFIFKHFPDARFVHVVRDGRDTAASMRKFGAQKFEDGQVVVQEPARRKPLRKYIKRWAEMVHKGLAWQDDPRAFLLKYEDLVLQPEPTLRRLFEFLEEPWEPAVLAFHQVKDASRDASKFPRSALATQPLFTSSLGKWRKELDQEDLRAVEHYAGSLLRRLGYAG